MWNLLSLHLDTNFVFSVYLSTIVCLSMSGCSNVVWSRLSGCMYHRVVGSAGVWLCLFLCFCLLTSDCVYRCLVVPVDVCYVIFIVSFCLPCFIYIYWYVDKLSINPIMNILRSYMHEALRVSKHKTHGYVCLCECVLARVSTRMRLCACVWVSMHVHIFAQTHTHTNLLVSLIIYIQYFRLVPKANVLITFCIQKFVITAFTRFILISMLLLLLLHILIYCFTVNSIININTTIIIITTASSNVIIIFVVDVVI